MASLFVGGRRWWCRGGWRRFACYGEWFHEFYARSVGVVEIYLAFAVDAYRNGERFAVGLECGTCLKDCDCLGHVGHCERDVIPRSPFIWRRKIPVEHEFDVVIAIGDAHVDPTQFVWIRATSPGLLKAKHVTIEVDGLLTVPDEKANVIDRGRDTGVWEELSCGLLLRPVGEALDELDQCSIGVLDFEGVVAGMGLAAAAGFDGDASRAQVGAHLLDVVHSETDVAHPVWRSGWRLIEELYMLMIVDLDEGYADVVRTWLVQREVLIVAKEVMPKVDCPGEVADEIAYMRDSRDARASRRCLLRAGGKGQSNREQTGASSEPRSDE